MRKMKKSALYLLFLLTLFALPAEARIPATQRIRLDRQWEYLKGDLGSVWEAVRHAEPGSPEAVPIWQAVTLPHCFNAEDAVDPDVNYYQGPGWYRTLIDLDNPWKDGRAILEFEGAGQKTEVYIYTRKVGTHVGGYDEWSIDITDALREALDNADCKKRFGGKVPLVVRCDNSRDTEMIPSDLSDFNVYGGLYRHVNLVYQPAVSFSGLKLETQVDEKLKKAVLKVHAGFHNPDDIRQGTVRMVLRDPSGKEVSRHEAVDVLPLGKVKLFEVTVKNPMLWSPDHPQLYTCEFTLQTAQTEQTVTERIGFRRFELVDYGPFKLNGERLLLRGTHRHEDHAGVGAAMTDEQMVAEMKLIKAMGANFIRLGHYQQSDLILRLCDELGILVWEEIPWCRGGLGGETYKAQARRMLTHMIEQHYNHPSIIFWGLGNENDWPNDFPVFAPSQIRAFMKELNDLAHDLDPSRATSIRRCDFCRDIVDVYSPTIWAGWYSKRFTDYKPMSENAMKKVKHFFHAEWGGDSHAGRHAEDPFRTIGGDPTLESSTESLGGSVSKKGDWSETYVVKLVDWHLKEQETMPWLTGSAYWTFKDFSTPLRPENPVPYVNQKGIVTRDLTPKEVFYVFQSYWTTKPMVHLYGHTWTTRWGAAGEAKEILVYSNCPAVELFVNGVSQGVKRRHSQDFPAAGLRWNCVLREGENRLKAVAVASKETVSDEITVAYQTAQWGEPAQLKVTTHPEGNGIHCVEVQLTDDKGIPCLDAANVITYGITGDGELIENQGTPTGSRKVHACNGKSMIRAKVNDSCCISVQAEGIKTVYIQLEN